MGLALWAPLRRPVRLHLLWVLGLVVIVGYGSKANKPEPGNSLDQGQRIQGQRIQVVATTGFLADIAARIAGGTAVVRSLLPQGSDPHRYEAVPNDTRILAQADLIIENGLHLEGWLDKLIARTAQKAHRIVATKGIVPIQDPEHADSYDPHAWMDPVWGRQYASNIYEALLGLCPRDSAGLRARWAAYDQELVDLNQEISGLLGHIPHQH
ncbi:MAG: zinc ABC transporter substrate-binding protein, partial [Bacteroidetes bacterium]|nr:zinc ABC transporter substrate-binding protein [Bacteroidota bacterium]